MTIHSPDLSQRTRDIALTLTSWPSVTGSADEVLFAERLMRFLNDVPGVDAWKELVPKDHLGRSNVFALKRGSSIRTIVLAGHFDTVPYDDYGPLKTDALEPNRLTKELIKQLEKSGESPLALADFKSGRYLAGRGLLDMKAGIAAGIAAMEASDTGATLLLVATPDEEDRSAGMRAAAPQLKQIAKRFGLSIELVINLDAISDQGDGSQGQVVALGSIGKQLLSAYVVGKPVHACYSQEGVNAAYVASELVTALELAPELAERTGAELAAAPTALAAKDLKQGYNVTTPAEAFVSWNTLQHRRTGAEVLAIARQLVQHAVDRARLRTGHDIELLTFADLQSATSSKAYSEFAKTVALRQELDLPEQCKLLMQEAWRRSGRNGPAVVLGFGSVPYPAVSLVSERIEMLVRQAAMPFDVGFIQYFPGISDMSFVGKPSGTLDVVEANTPHWGTSFKLSEPAGYPCINIGPWGRDYHAKLERLYTPYAFETLPRLLMAVIDAVAKAG